VEAPGFTPGVAGIIDPCHPVGALSARAQRSGAQGARAAIYGRENIEREIYFLAPQARAQRSGAASEIVAPGDMLVALGEFCITLPRSSFYKHTCHKGPY
jgi:hypothetical protein